MITIVDRPPHGATLLPEPTSEESQREGAQQVAELFSASLRGAYSWSYENSDELLGKLYKLGKERNWNSDFDIDWSRTYPRHCRPMIESASSPYVGWAPYDALGESGRIEFGWHQNAWVISQFLHGEQGALLVASQLVNCAPSYEAKLYAASQTFDEARHVEVFSRYLREKARIVYPVNKSLKSLLDMVLTDTRWDLKFIGMQLIIESLALAAFAAQRAMTADPLLRDILDLVAKDESRHVAFGVSYMREIVADLSQAEIEDRAQFALEACLIMREHIVPLDVFEQYGFSPEQGRERFLQAGHMASFRNLLFTRIMPNLKRVGLLTAAVSSRYEEVGLMEFAKLPYSELEA